MQSFDCTKYNRYGFTAKGQDCANVETIFNPNGAQLIFTSYNTNLLDLDVLRRDQIWFAEKDELTAATDLFSLQAFSIRKDTKLEKGYLIGHYGAIPFIKGGL